MFKGKVMIITGSSSGIGAGAAIKFANEGAAGIVLHGRNEKALNEVKEKCIYASGVVKVSICAGDITDNNVRINLIDTAISEFGQLDVLVNNAGIASGGGLCESTIDDYDKIFNVNLRSPMVLSQLAVPHLLKTKGNIVNISSVTGLKPNCVALYYSCSKAALNHFTKCLAIELGPKGIRVNSINPGFVPETNLITRNPQSVNETALKKAADSLAEILPLRCAGEVGEIADAIAFVGSDQATWITGTIFPVDGGYCLT